MRNEFERLNYKRKKSERKKEEEFIKKYSLFDLNDLSVKKEEEDKDGQEPSQL